MKKNVEAIMAMEMIQKEMAQQSCGGKKASLGSETGFVDDIGAPMVASVVPAPVRRPTLMSFKMA